MLEVEQAEDDHELQRTISDKIGGRIEQIFFEAEGTDSPVNLQGGLSGDLHQYGSLMASGDEPPTPLAAKPFPRNEEAKVVQNGAELVHPPPPPTNTTHNLLSPSLAPLLTRARPQGPVHSKGKSRNPATKVSARAKPVERMVSEEVLESPRTILKDMAKSPAPGGQLLSPLPDNILHAAKTKRSSKGAPVKLKVNLKIGRKKVNDPETAPPEQQLAATHVDQWKVAPVSSQEPQQAENPSGKKRKHDSPQGNSAKRPRPVGGNEQQSGPSAKGTVRPSLSEGRLASRQDSKISPSQGQPETTKRKPNGIRDIEMKDGPSDSEESSEAVISDVSEDEVSEHETGSRSRRPAPGSRGGKASREVKPAPNQGRGETRRERQARPAGKALKAGHGPNHTDRKDTRGKALKEGEDEDDIAVLEKTIQHQEAMLAKLRAQKMLEQAKKEKKPSSPRDENKIMAEAKELKHGADQLKDSSPQQAATKYMLAATLFLQWAGESEKSAAKLEGQSRIRGLHEAGGRLKQTGDFCAFVADYVTRRLLTKSIGGSSESRRKNREQSLAFLALASALAAVSFTRSLYLQREKLRSDTNKIKEVCKLGLTDPNSNRTSSTDVNAKAGSTSAQSNSDKAKKGEQGPGSYGSPDSEVAQHKTDTPPDSAQKAGAGKSQSYNEGVVKKAEAHCSNMLNSLDWWSRTQKAIAALKDSGAW
mmetsp:Transcript_9101/g.33402  ORF Transcript_9101/g.33402 Transcript_9101/m.33402 type:complete len:704 (+) Transcript_9101:127-2238(+)